MKHVPVAAFKDRVSEYISEAEAGDEIIITRHGKPAARLVPIVDEASLQVRRQLAVSNLLAFRDRSRKKGLRVSAEDWVAFKNEGRR